jgi:hypothetical protein
MKKLPFPKNTTRMCAYFMKDGLVFHFYVEQKIGDKTISNEAIAVLRINNFVQTLPAKEVKREYVPWFLEVGLADRPSYFPVSELLNIVRVYYSSQAYLNEAAFHDKTGNVEHLRVEFKRGYTLESYYCEGLDHCFGQMDKTRFISKTINTIEEYLANNKSPVAFDLQRDDLE